MTDDEREARIDANEPRLHKCENCAAPLPEGLEGCSCDTDANWFCAECFADLFPAADERLRAMTEEDAP